MRKLGVSLIENTSTPMEEQIKMIKDCGFDCFFSPYYKDEPIDKWKELAEKIGLVYETVHLPFYTENGLTANNLWIDDLAGEEYYNHILKQIDGCSKNEIPIGVMHLSSCSEGPEITSFGVDRFKRICEYAQMRNVRLAFENLELAQHLHSVMEIIGDFHGFCWDCGHNLCYTPETDMSLKYQDKLICTHIHDNFGVTKPGNIHWHDDLHLLPFDGKLDWEWYGKRIKETGYTGPLTLELSLKSREEYKKQPLDEFFKTAFERVKKILEFTDNT